MVKKQARDADSDEGQDQRFLARAARLLAEQSQRKVDAPNLTQRPAWRDITVTSALPPSDLTVTHINQTYTLWKEKDKLAGQADEQDSEEWLKTHDVKSSKLTLKDLVDKGKIGKPVADTTTGKVRQHLQFDAAVINEFEYNLNLVIQNYTNRIKWLLHGSRRTFGLVKGSKVAVMVDASEANTGFGRLTAFRESLLHLIDEQLSKKQKLYLVSFGTDTHPLWEVPRDVNCRIIDEAKAWVNDLASAGGCNFLKALKHVLKVKDIDYVLVVLGSVPDQDPELLCDYAYQMCLGQEKPFHSVAYDCSNNSANNLLRDLATTAGGRYHCYTSTNEEQIYTGHDISYLLREVQVAQDVINKIKAMRKGMMGTALVSIMDEISLEVAKLPQSRFLPHPPGHYQPLRLDPAKFNPKTSDEWLQKNGLKAKNLDLYQLLLPNAYECKEQFVPVLRKTVSSVVNQGAMTPFVWSDGSTRNVHVDLAQLFEYQKHLGGVVKLYEDRVNWLSSGSRKIFGTVVEKNIVVLVDLSVSNANYLVHIQHSLRLLLEQQIANKDYFNLITFGSEVKKWRSTLTKVTPESLQDAWKFVLTMECGGSRNFLAAFRAALENDEEARHGITVEGIYLFGSGVPDQAMDVTVSFIEERTAGMGCALHTVLFNVDDYDTNGAIPGRWSNITATADFYRTLAHVASGRFHWFRETGIIESDDIRSVSSEIERAVSYSQKCAMLVDTVKSKYKNKQGSSQHDSRFHLNCLPPREALCAAPSAAQLQALPPAHAESGDEKKVTFEQLLDSNDTEVKAVNRPGSAKSVKSSASRLSTASSRVSSASQTTRSSVAKDLALTKRDPMEKVKISQRKPSMESFYLEDQKGQTGSVFKGYPSTKSVRKDIPRIHIPDTEDALTTKQWLKMYSLSKLRLDLFKLVSGPDCKHVDKSVPSLNRHVGAKYCDIFPTVNVGGTLKHLQLLPHELEEYERQVEYALKRYIKRLQWLLSGSRRIFGTVVDQKCAVLVDVSGSMLPHMVELRKELASLVWDQLFPLKAKFNLISFSQTVNRWMTCLADAAEENCHDAVRWASELQAGGNTCTLEAIQAAFEDKEVNAIYLLSDGKPDYSTQFILKEVAKMNEERRLVVNTISFNCTDKTANEFLKLLAAETNGRYHRCQGDFDADLFAHRILTEGFSAENVRIPEFEGDDLRRLASEIALARKFLTHVKAFRMRYNDRKSGTDENAVGKVIRPSEMLSPAS